MWGTVNSDRKRTVSVQRCGFMTVIHMRGGPDCLWLNMYLDNQKWQMTCDSDVGHYAYRWHSPSKMRESFEEFCLSWLAKEDWLLRKCVDERHAERTFDIERTVDGLRKFCLEYGDDDFDVDQLDDVIDEAYSFSQSADAWSAAVQLVADVQGVELPEEWYECICMEYTPHQKRFAEICREVLVPALFAHVTGRKDDNDAEKVEPAAAVAAEETSAGMAVKPGEPGVLPVRTTRVVDLNRIPVIQEGERIYEVE